MIPYIIIIQNSGDNNIPSIPNITSIAPKTFPIVCFTNANIPAINNKIPNNII